MTTPDAGGSVEISGTSKIVGAVYLAGLFSFVAGTVIQWGFGAGAMAFGSSIMILALMVTHEIDVRARKQ